MYGGNRFREIPEYKSSSNKNNPFKTNSEKKVINEKIIEKKMKEEEDNKILDVEKKTGDPFETNEEKKIKKDFNKKSYKKDYKKEVKKDFKKKNFNKDYKSLNAEKNYLDKFPKYNARVHPKNKMVEINNQDNLIEFKVSNDLPIVFQLTHKGFS